MRGAWDRHVDDHAPWAGHSDPDCVYCRHAATRAVLQDVRRQLRPNFDDEEVTQPDAQPVAARAVTS